MGIAAGRVSRFGASETFYQICGSGVSDLTMVVADQLQANDALLLPFLNASDQGASEEALSELISLHAQPAIKDIVGYRLRSFLSVADMQDIEDVHGTAITRLLTHLHRLKSNPSERFISNFRSYVAVIAYNACHEYLRRKYPQRSKLKNRLRYLFSHHPKLAIWEDENGEMLCGLSEWKDKKADSLTLVKLRRFEDGESDSEQSLSKTQLRRSDMGDGMILLLNWLEGSVGLDVLLSVVADIWDIKDQTVSYDHESEDSPDSVETLQDQRVDIEAEVERKLFLQQLWGEIRLLPAKQRSALLLNL